MVKTQKPLADNLGLHLLKMGMELDRAVGATWESSALLLALVFLWCQGRQYPSKVIFPTLSYPTRLKQEQKR